MEVTASVTDLTHYKTVAVSNYSAAIYLLNYNVLFCDVIAMSSDLYLMVDLSMVSNGSSYNPILQNYAGSVLLYGVYSVYSNKYVLNTKWGWTIGDNSSDILNINVNGIQNAYFSVVQIGKPD